MFCKDFSVDQFSTFWGCLDNWTGRDPANYTVSGRRQTRRAAEVLLAALIDRDQVERRRDSLLHVPPGSAVHRRTRIQRVFGNVFDKGLGEIWNSTVIPAGAPPDGRSDGGGAPIPELKNHFCDSCPVLFETTYQETTAWGNRETFEEMYSLNEKGKPVRREKKLNVDRGEMDMGS